MFKQILSILGLRDENAFNSLFDLKTKKVVQLPNHAHLKFLLHLPENSQARESRVAIKMMSSTYI
jgi:hypothetical protein